MKRLSLILLLVLTFLVIDLNLDAGTASTQARATLSPVAGNPPLDLLMEIKIRRARWNLDVESLRTGGTVGVTDQDIKVAIGPAEDDLVLRQVISVSCGNTPTKSVEFGPEGGTITTNVTGGDINVKVLIEIEFVPATGLPMVSKSIEKQTSGDGLLIAFQAFSDTTNIVIDRGAFGSYGDFMLADLEQTPKEIAQPQRQLILSTIAQRIVCSSVVFNVFGGDTDPSLQLQIVGRLQGRAPTQLALLDSQALREVFTLTPRWDACKNIIFLSKT